MRILYIATESWFFVSHFLDRAKAAQMAGYEVYVAAKNSGRVDTIIDNDIKFVELNVARGWEGSFDCAKTLWELRCLIRSVNPKIIHNIAIKVMLLSNMSTLGMKCGVHVNAPVGFGYIFSSFDLKAVVMRALFGLIIRPVVRRKGAVFIVENLDDWQYIVDCKWANSKDVFLVEGAGVDLIKFNQSKLPNGKRYVVLVARMLRDKGVFEFVSAARQLKKKWPEVGFRLVGDPDIGNPSSVKIEQLIEWRQEGVVEWMGFQDDIVGILSDCWLFCLPSYREGLPKSVIEAMAVGRPVVTCDVPGCRSLVQDGKNGILVKPKDALALAFAIDSILKDEDKATLFGLASRQIAENRLSTEMISSQTISLYQKVISDNECI